MNWKGIVVLVIFIGFGTIAIVYFALGKPVQFTKFEHDGLKSLAPDWNATRYKLKKGWEGWRFSMGTAVFRILWRKILDPEHDYRNLVSSLNSYKYRFDVPLFDGGRYALKRYRKGYKVVVLFRFGDRIYWIDQTTNSTLRKYKQVVDVFLLNLKINEKAISPRAREIILSIDRQIPITFIQTKRQIVGIMIVIYTLVVLGMILGLKYFGACPRVPDAIVCSPMSILRTKSTFKSQYSTCCVCLGSEYVSVYTRKKLIFEVPLTELYRSHDFLVKGKLSYGDYSITINNFHRWKPYIPPPVT